VPDQSIVAGDDANSGADGMAVAGVPAVGRMRRASTSTGRASSSDDL
jgi:hypothetical protein